MCCPNALRTITALFDDIISSVPLVRIYIDIDFVVVGTRSRRQVPRLLAVFLLEAAISASTCLDSAHGVIHLKPLPIDLVRPECNMSTPIQKHANSTPNNLYYPSDILNSVKTCRQCTSLVLDVNMINNDDKS